MTSEETKSLKPGTEILVRMTIGDKKAVYGSAIFSETSNGINGYVRPEDIYSIAPPKPLAVGDRVEDFSGNPGEIIAIHRDEAWVDYGKGTRCFTRRLATLTRIKDEPK